MNSLESEQSPLRTYKHYHQSLVPRRHSHHRRNFPEIYKTISPILDAPDVATNVNSNMSTVQYVGEMGKNRLIHRRFMRNQQYYPDPEKSRKREQNMYSTIGSRKKSLGFFQHQQLQTQRNRFLQTFRQKSQKKQQMNQSFYNTTSKSKIIMQKFHDDKNLNERSSPVFQNMLHRTLVMDDIMGKVRLNERKFVKGW